MEWELVSSIVIILLELVIIKGLIEINGALNKAFGGLQEIFNNVVQNMGGDGFEPPNPIQQALAQLLVSRIQNAPGPLSTLEAVETISRSPDGKFSKE